MKKPCAVDVSAIQKQITGEFGPWGKELEITQERINRFADVTEDHQWVHVDVERANKPKREGLFRGTIAHGFLTLSLIPALLPEIVGFGGTSTINHAGKYAFVNPVPSGSRVHARMRLISAKQTGERKVIIEAEVEVALAGTDKVVLTATLQFAVF